SRGTSLELIGLASWASLPWALKFLWAPLVDRLGSRRAWIIGCQIGLAAVLAGFVVASPGGTPFFGLLFALVALSATQDIAVDAATIESAGKEELGPADGIRVTAYRVAMIGAGGVMVALSGRLGWHRLFLGAAVFFLLLAVINLRLPAAAKAAGARTPILEPVRDLLSSPGIVGVLV